MRIITSTGCGPRLIVLCLLLSATGWAQRPVEVQEIKVSRASGGVEVEVLASGAVKPRSMRLADPERIVVDIPNAVPGKELRRVPVNAEGVIAVRSGRFQDDPPVTRVVVDLVRASDFDLLAQGNRLLIKVRPPASAAAARPTAVISPPRPPAPKVSPPRSAGWVEVEALAVHPKDTGVQIEVSATGAVMPRTQRLSDPDRIVVDLLNAIPGEELHRVSVNRNGVRAVRVGRFQDDPPVTRVVVDLSQASDFELLPEGNRLFVKVYPAVTAPVSAPSATTVASTIVSPAATPMLPARNEPISGSEPGASSRFEPPQGSASSLNTAPSIQKVPVGPPAASTVSTATTGDRTVSDPLLITRIVTDESAILSEEEIRGITSRYEQKPITQAKLARLIDEFNKLYAAKGFATARAVLPEQTVQDGVINIRLIEGRVGKVVVHKQTHTRDSYFLNRVPASGGEIMDLQQLRQSLVYFNATNDLKLRAVLAPGAQFGTTDLTLETDAPRDLQITTFTDNAGRDTIGLYRGGVNAVYRSLFGNRDPLTASFVGANGTLAGGGSYSVPLGTRGMRLAALFNYNTIALSGGIVGSTGMEGHSYDAALKLSRPLVARAAGSLSASLAAHFKTSLLSSEGFPLSRTEVRSLEFSTDFQRLDGRGGWFGTNGVNGGFYNLAGNYEFLRYNGALTRTLVFSPNVAMMFRASGQVNALNALASIEQMQIGGVATVRGYPEAALIGDRGYAATGELNFPIAKNDWVKKRIKMATFVDTGAVFNTGMNGSNTPQDTRLLSTGFGFILKFSNYMSGRVDFGVPLRNKTGIPDVGIHFSVQSSFEFPRRWAAPTVTPEPKRDPVSGPGT